MKFDIDELKELENKIFSAEEKCNAILGAYYWTTLEYIEKYQHFSKEIESKFKKNLEETETINFIINEHSEVEINSFCPDGNHSLFKVPIEWFDMENDVAQSMAKMKVESELDEFIMKLILEND